MREFKVKPVNRIGTWPLPHFLCQKKNEFVNHKECCIGYLTAIKIESLWIIMLTGERWARKANLHTE